MRKAFIFGAGGCSKEVFLLLKRLGHYEFCGFINNEDTLSHRSIGAKEFQVFDEDKFLHTYSPTDNVSLFIGIGNPNIIEKITTKFSKFNFPNLVCPGVEIDESVYFGSGNIVFNGVSFTVDTRVGSFNLFSPNSTIGHDVTIGDCNVINPGASVSGGIRLGNCNLIGTGASILQYLDVGDHNTIGANGVLTKSINNSKVMVGVPCKEMQIKK